MSLMIYETGLHSCRLGEPPRNAPRKVDLAVSTITRTALIADPFPLYIGALEHLLADTDIDVLLSTTSPTEALQRILANPPDLLIVGIELRDDALDGVGLVRQARESDPEIKIVALSEAADAQTAAVALSAGASAYVAKTAHPADLMSAIRQVFDPSLYMALPTAYRTAPPSADEAAHGLTKREVEILQHTAEGRSNGEIARSLWVTDQTVKFHLSNIYRKLGVSNRTEASRWAQRNGLLSAGALNGAAPNVVPTDDDTPRLSEPERVSRRRGSRAVDSALARYCVTRSTR